MRWGLARREEVGESCELTEYVNHLAISEHLHVGLECGQFICIVHYDVSIVRENCNMYAHHRDINPGVNSHEECPLECPDEVYIQNDLHKK